MTAAVEVWAIAGRRTLELAADRVTVGKGAENDLALDDDDTVSRLHAVLDRFPAGWCVTDLGSSNGTYVNGERIFAPRRLQHGDEVRIGSTKLLFRNSADVGRTVTKVPTRAPRSRPASAMCSSCCAGRYSIVICSLNRPRFARLRHRLRFPKRRSSST
jgi:pSer/pThr/pTyr-binding forkhead associated (FHA) protein